MGSRYVCLYVILQHACKWEHTHLSFSNSPLQSTTGPPLPMRSRVCKLTGNKQARVQQYEGLKSDTVEGFVLRSVRPYPQSAPELHHCPRHLAYIDRDAGLEVGES